MTKTASDQRDEARAAFLTAHGWGSAKRWLLAADASFRHYDRLEKSLPDGRTERVVLMDAPPQSEDIRPFLSIAQHLLDLGYSAPKPLAQDRAQGFLLLEDFGDQTFSKLIAENHDETALYALATDLLADLHRTFPAKKETPNPLPAAYDGKAFLAEAQLFLDWYVPVVEGRAPGPGQTDPQFEALILALVPVMQGRIGGAGAESLVLRDFHVDNLMIVPERTGLQACGLLDFQDALMGPRSYDLMSLLRDARRDVPEDLQQAMKDRYLTACPGIHRETFEASYAALAVQRGLKILGIFTRLSCRDSKHGYLRHIERVWRLLEEDLCHPALSDMRHYLELRLPSEKRITLPI